MKADRQPDPGNGDLLSKKFRKPGISGEEDAFTMHEKTDQAFEILIKKNLLPVPALSVWRPAKPFFTIGMSWSQTSK